MADVAVEAGQGSPPRGQTAGAPNAAGSESGRVVVIHSRSARLAGRIQGARHAAVGVALAASSASAWAAGVATWPDVVGLIGGLGVLGAFVVTLRRDRLAKTVDGALGHGSGVGWVDVGAAVVTAVEAWHLHHQGKQGLPVAYGFAALLLLAVGLLHGRLNRLRRLIVSGSGLDFRASPWHRRRVSWADVGEMHREGRHMIVRRHDGRMLKIDCSRVENADAVLDALDVAAATYLGSKVSLGREDGLDNTPRRNPAAGTRSNTSWRSVMRSSLRSIVAIVAGVVIVNVLITLWAFVAVLAIWPELAPRPDGTYSFPAGNHPAFALEMVVNIPVAVVGAYVCASVARRRETWHVMALGSVLLLLSVGYAAGSLGAEFGAAKPMWAHVGTAIGLVVGLWTGVRLWRRRTSRRPSVAAPLPTSH